MSLDADYLAIITRDLEQMQFTFFANCLTETKKQPELPDIFPTPKEYGTAAQSIVPIEASEDDPCSDHIMNAKLPDVVPAAISTTDISSSLPKEDHFSSHVCNEDGECEDLACCQNLLRTRYGSVRGIRNGVRKSKMDYALNQRLSVSRSILVCKWCQNS